MNDIVNYKLFRLKLLKYALHLGCKYQQAEDLVHEVIIKELETENIRDEKLSYFKVILKNRYVDYLRKKQRIIDIQLDLNLTEDKAQDFPTYQKRLLIDEFSNKHKYGYIIKEMHKRNMYKVSELCPFLNENAEVLYKRFSKFKADFQTYIKIVKLNELEMNYKKINQ